GRHQKRITPELAPPAQDDAVALKLEQNLLEELARNSLLGRNFSDHHRVALAGERDEGAESIFCLLRDHLGGQIPYLICRVDRGFAGPKQCPARFSLFLPGARHLTKVPALLDKQGRGEAPFRKNVQKAAYQDVRLSDECL